MSFFCGGQIDNLVVPSTQCELFVCVFVYLLSTSGRTYQLQAKDKQTMMFWLQELQVMVLTFFFSSWAFSSLHFRVKSFWERFRILKLNKRNGRWVVE